MRKSAPRARLCTSGTDEIYLYSRPAASGGVRSLWRSRTHSHSLGRGAKLLHPTPHGPRDTGRARCHSPLKGQYPPYPLRPPPRALLHPYRRLPQVRTPRPPPRHRPRRVLPVLCYLSRPLSRRPLRSTPRRTPTTVTGPIHHNHRHRYARSDPNGGGACVSTAHSDRCSHSPSLPPEVATPTLAVTPTLGPTETLPESPTPDATPTTGAAGATTRHSHPPSPGTALLGGGSEDRLARQPGRHRRRKPAGGSDGRLPWFYRLPGIRL